MGPDGGPYIAINENSGNIELEDNTGTTVAIWDDANSQWDFQNNPISNVDSLTSNSVNTGRAIIGEFGPTVTLSAPQTISSGTITKVQFDSIDAGDADSFDTANNKYVVPADGDYLVTGGVRFDSDSGWSTGDSMNAILNLNGGTLYDTNNNKTGTGEETSTIPLIRYSLTSGDEITLSVFQDSGAGKTVAGGSIRTVLSVVRFA